MEKLIWIVIGLIVYFGGGWIAKDIVFSLIYVDSEITFGELMSYEFKIYSFIAGAISLIALFYNKNGNKDIGFFSLLAIGFTCAVTIKMPLSLGLIILYNIINVGAIIWTICTNDGI